MITIQAESVEQALDQLGGKPGKEFVIKIRWRKPDDRTWVHKPGCVVECFAWECPREFTNASDAAYTIDMELRRHDEYATLCAEASEVGISPYAQSAEMLKAALEARRVMKNPGAAQTVRDIARQSEFETYGEALLNAAKIDLMGARNAAIALAETQITHRFDEGPLQKLEPAPEAAPDFLAGNPLRRRM